MSATKLFITGGTGYIGGSVLEAVVKKYPELQVTAILRKPSAQFKDRYPQVKIVVGDFDAFEVIQTAASDADIVIHTGDMDHPGCVAAILSGLKSKTTPSFLIHLTGTGCISDAPEQTWEGKLNPFVWDDVTDIQKIYDLPDSVAHHTIDRQIMDASNDLLKTVSICPPDIYGQTTGVGKRESFMVPLFVKVAMAKKEAFYLGEGKNMRAVTHINDVVSLFLLILAEALQGGGKAQWGKEGFYFGVADEVQWIDAATAINNLGVKQGCLPPNSRPVSWTKEQIGGITPPLPGLYIWGSNSRARSTRAKQLGWKPAGPSFFEALEEDVTLAINSKGADQAQLAFAAALF